jgi:hypothetical protein
VPFQKEPIVTLMQVIPVLIKEIQALAGMNKLTETNIKANASSMLKFYWHIQKLFISKNQRSFTLLPLSHFKCRKAEFGMNNLQDIKLDFSDLHNGLLIQQKIFLLYENHHLFRVGQKGYGIRSPY